MNWYLVAGGVITVGLVGWWMVAADRQEAREQADSQAATPLRKITPAGTRGAVAVVFGTIMLALSVAILFVPGAIVRPTQVGFGVVMGVVLLWAGLAGQRPRREP